MRGTVAKRIRREVRAAGGKRRAYRLAKKLHNGTADIAPMDPEPSRPRSQRRRASESFRRWRPPPARGSKPPYNKVYVAADRGVS